MMAHRAGPMPDAVALTEYWNGLMMEGPERSITSAVVNFCIRWTLKRASSWSAVEVAEMAQALAAHLIAGGCLCDDLSTGEVVGFRGCDAERLIALAVARQCNPDA